MTTCTPTLIRVCAALLAFGLALALSGAPAHAQTDVVALSECADGVSGIMSPWLEALDGKPDYRTRVGDNIPWGITPSIESGDSRVGEGQGHYLDEDYRQCSTSFMEAFDIYSKALGGAPFCEECYKKAISSGFWWGACTFLANDKNKARDVLERFFDQFPVATPQANLYPDRFTRFVKDVQRSMRRRKGSLLVTTAPEQARVVLNGRALEQREGEARARDLPLGEYAVAAGAPGIGVFQQVVDVTDGTTVDLDLFQTSDALKAPCGLPADNDLLYKLINLERPPRYLLLFTSAQAIGRTGYLVFMHGLPKGNVTAVFHVPSDVTNLSAEQAGALAQAVADGAATDDDREGFRLEGSVIVEDAALLEEVASLTDEIKIPPPSTGLGPIRLGLGIGLGAGLVEGTESAGFAQSLVVVRPDIGYGILESLDVGVMLRAQVPRFLFLAHPYVRYRMGLINLRGGVAIGQTGQTVNQTTTTNEGGTSTYERDVTQGVFGPSGGFELQIGNVVLGADVHSLLVPDTTVQIDLVAGFVFDIGGQ